MFVLFWDMHSGGGLKEQWDKIIIEADSEDAASIIFYNRFGHNPERVTCTCCGEDYSISSSESLAQLTGFHRNCRSIETPRDPNTGRYVNDDPVMAAGCYLEDGEEPPEGYSLSSLSRGGEYMTVDAYLAKDSVLFIPEGDIKHEWRTGSIPRQGYVWVGDEDAS